MDCTQYQSDVQVTRPRWYRPSVLLVAAGALGLTVLETSAPGAAGDVAIPAYAASASAVGAHLVVTIPRFPVTDTPVSSGGPTAQALRDSSGTNQGYAAFPDPGQSLVSVPSLVSGLLALGGAGGLPPLTLPSLPAYPLYVSSDPAVDPQASAGTGPYHLRATSAASATTATATAGLQTDAAGNIALTSSTASITEMPDGSVVATAVTDAQGISMGPITIGEVRSTATMTLNGSTVRPRSEIEVSGMQVGGLPVASVTAEGLSLAGTAVPLPIPGLLVKLLGPAQLAPTIVTPKQFPGRVVSPAFQLTAPLTIPYFGAGSYTLTVGSATATMLGAGPLGPVAPSTAPPAKTGGLTPPPGTGAGMPTLPQAAPLPTTEGAPVGAPPGTALAEPAQVALGPLQLSAQELAAIKILYLIVAALACVMAILGQTIRWGRRL